MRKLILIMICLLLSACYSLRPSKSELENWCNERDYWCGRLGAYYYEKDDYKNALIYHTKSCNKDNKASCHDAAISCEMLEDYDNAILFYKKLNELGQPLGLSRIGDLYKNGLGVAKDFNKALELYMQACELGSKEACKNLAKIYETGENVRANPLISKAYKKRAEKANKW